MARLVARVALILVAGSVIRLQHGDEVLLAIVALTHIIGEGVLKVGGLALDGNSLHIHGVMLAALAHGHGTVTALETDVALAQVLVGERHPHSERLAGGHSIGFDIKGEGDVDPTPVTHAIGVGGGAHGFEVILAAGEE